jgi:hypothetical protein
MIGSQDPSDTRAATPKRLEILFINNNKIKSPTKEKHISAEDKCSSRYGIAPKSVYSQG